MNNDSIEIALANSVLLAELQAYNDSINSTPEIQPMFFNWFNRNLHIITADANGFAIGSLLGSILSGGNPIVALTLGVSYATMYSSIAKETQNAPDYNNIKKLPANYFSKLEVFDRYQALANNDSEIAQQYSLLGDLTAFRPYQEYLKAGALHNITICKYRSNIDYTDIENINGSLASLGFISILYNDSFQEILASDIQSLLNNSINLNYMMSNRVNKTQTISQAKAAQTLQLFNDALNSQSSLDGIKNITIFYMNTVNVSSEILKIEKTTLLNALPVAMFSTVLWKGNYEMM